MHCPNCSEPTLRQQATKQGSLVDVCSRCQGIWLDRGEIYDFTPRPQVLDERLAAGLRDCKPSTRRCPRCDLGLEEGAFLGQATRVDACSRCGGMWFDAGEVAAVLRSAEAGLQVDLVEPEPLLPPDPEMREKAQERHQQIAAGLLGLPNLFLRSALTLTLLYGLVTLVLVTLVQLHYFGPTVALAIGVVFAAVQFTLGPWILDLFLYWVGSCRWAKPEELPEHLRAFIQRVTAEHKMPFPHFGIIDDGAPTAFTYGHHPGNARVVISRGLMELLEPEEVEAVVAHELGHARNWDMALMTIANLVPLLLYFLYRVALDRGSDKVYSWAVSIGAYVLYVVSEYIVLLFSRTREYYADRFAGQVTGNPNALASALVKIAYGLAAQGPAVTEEKEGEEEDEAAKKAKKEQERRTRFSDAIGALNIFDKKAAVGLVMASAPADGASAGKLDPEQVKSAMQWDLWNPWASFYELHSTHPLVAKRLQHLGDQAASHGKEPLVVFDRRRPESYWDEFAIDLFMACLPLLGWLVALGGFGVQVLTGGGWGWWWGGVGLALACLGSLAKTAFAYRRDFFPHLSVAALLHKVKVSDVRPVPATLTGTIIGRGMPGVIFSEDFVLRDHTGILFLDYRQPLAIWNVLFGLLKAGDYQGKEVRVSGWFRRAPVPYLELNQLEVLDGSAPKRRCYTLHARLIFGALGAALGAVVAAALWAIL